MDKIYKYNINIVIQNIHKQLNIPLYKLKKLSKEIKLSNIDIETKVYKLPIYNDYLGNKYALLSNIKDDVFFALLIK